jgi:leucyl/phenylalanyl-tRNA---protein transferase
MPQIDFGESDFTFPSVDEADDEGLVMIGGAVTPQRIVEAYKKGIFPWYNDDSLPLWWSPDPRFVLFPNELHISRSMAKIIRQGKFEFKINTAFEDVMRSCANIERNDQDGTWITPNIKQAYTGLHHQGIAHSAETWLENKLVGGMYGIRLGNIFFGESMFSTVPNSSKFAFISYSEQLLQQGVQLIDCQVHTTHVESLGARLIPRSDYLRLLQNNLR